MRVSKRCDRAVFKAEGFLPQHDTRIRHCLRRTLERRLVMADMTFSAFAENNGIHNTTEGNLVPAPHDHTAVAVAKVIDSDRET